MVTKRDGMAGFKDSIKPLTWSGLRIRTKCNQKRKNIQIKLLTGNFLSFFKLHKSINTSGVECILQQMRSDKFRRGFLKSNTKNSWFRRFRNFSNLFTMYTRRCQTQLFKTLNRHLFWRFPSQTDFNLADLVYWSWNCWFTENS